MPRERIGVGGANRMTIRPWMIQAALIAALCCFTAWLGWSACDTRWQLRDDERKLSDAEASARLSEQYRAKEQKLNETIGEIETRAINDAANAEMEYQAVMDRLRNASAHATDGLRVKRELTCGVSGSASTASGGNDQAQGGLSTKVAEDVIGIGRESDEVARQLALCQDYAQLCYETHK